MSLQTLTGTPLQIQAGDTIIWTENFSDFPNTSWTAKFVLNMGPNAPIILDATNSGSDFLFTFARTLTAGIPHGVYDFSILCFATTQRATGKTGIITILPDLAQAVVPSFAAAQVTLLQTAIATLSTGANQSVSFNGQSFSKYDIASLQKTLTFYQAQVIAEQNKLNAQRGAPDPGRIVTRFVPQDNCTAFPFGF